MDAGSGGTAAQVQGRLEAWQLASPGTAELLRPSGHPHSIQGRLENPSLGLQSPPPPVGHCHMPGGSGCFCTEAPPSPPRVE
jgi:hypothetical protein